MQDDWRNIWIIALYEGTTHSVSLLKLLGYARLLGDNAGSWVEVLAIGKNVSEEMGKELIQYGADNVYIVKSDKLEIYNVERVAKLIEKVVREKKPQFILMVDNKLNRAIAGYLSGKFNSPAITECIKLDIDPYDMILRGSKPVFEGRLLAVLEAKSGYPQIATVKPLLYSLPFKDEFRSGRVNMLDVNLDELDVKTKLISEEKAEPIKPHNWKSKVVIAMGEEVGDGEKFNELVSVMEKMEVYVGGTKKAVDMGIVPRDRLLGPLGKIIRPDLLITIGSMYAPETLYGFEKTPHILAVAKNTEYPVVKESRYYAIGDAAELTDLLIQEVKKLLEGG